MLINVWSKHAPHYFSPKYFNYNWGFDSILGLIVALQIMTGVLLDCYYRLAKIFAASFFKNSILRFMRNLKNFVLLSTTKNVKFLSCNIIFNNILVVLSNFFIKITSSRICGLLIIFNANPNGGGKEGFDWIEFLLVLTISCFGAISLVLIRRKFMTWYNSKNQSNSVSAENSPEINSKNFRDHIYDYVSAKFNSSEYPDLKFIKSNRDILPDYADLVNTYYS